MITVIIPCYNEVKTINIIIDKVYKQKLKKQIKIDPNTSLSVYDYFFPLELNLRGGMWILNPDISGSIRLLSTDSWH